MFKAAKSHQCPDFAALNTRSNSNVTTMKVHLINT